MKSRLFANLCLTLLLLFAQHIALADAYTHQVRHAISDQTQSVLDDDSTSADNSDTGSHLSLNDLDSGLISAFVSPTSANTAQIHARSSSSDFFTVLSQFYSTRAPPAL